MSELKLKPHKITSVEEYVNLYNSEKVEDLLSTHSLGFYKTLIPGKIADEILKRDFKILELQDKNRKVVKASSIIYCIALLETAYIIISLVGNIF